MQHDIRGGSGASASARPSKHKKQEAWLDFLYGLNLN
jgi:hypothetical protein